jgi:hypothetical protein
VREIGKWHQLESALRFDGIRQIRLPVDEDPHSHGAPLGSRTKLHHFPRNGTGEVRTGDDVDARLLALGAADVLEDLVVIVAELNEVPTVLEQFRNVDKCRLHLEHA